MGGESSSREEDYREEHNPEPEERRSIGGEVNQALEDSPSTKLAMEGRIMDKPTNQVTLKLPKMESVLSVDFPSSSRVKGKTELSSGWAIEAPKVDLGV
ncbi:hypothetical protein U1Q18_026255 [Sarracenia purpurea var. burkii]